MKEQIKEKADQNVSGVPNDQYFFIEKRAGPGVVMVETSDLMEKHLGQNIFILQLSLFFGAAVIRFEQADRGRGHGVEQGLVQDRGSAFRQGQYDYFVHRMVLPPGRFHSNRAMIPVTDYRGRMKVAGPVPRKLFPEGYGIIYPGVLAIGMPEHAC